MWSSNILCLTFWFEYTAKCHFSFGDQYLDNGGLTHLVRLLTKCIKVHIKNRRLKLVCQINLIKMYNNKC